MRSAGHQGYSCQQRENCYQALVYHLLREHGYVTANQNVPCGPQPYWQTPESLWHTFSRE